MRRFTGRRKVMAGEFRDMSFDEIQVGFEFTTESRVITEQDVVDFARLSGDDHPEHLDEEYARASIHGERIAHGLLVASVMTGLVNRTGLLERSTIGVLEMKTTFIKAVKFRDVVTVTGAVPAKRATSKPDRGIVTIAATVLNQRGESVLEAEWKVMVKRT
jgi:acyl dehydratase